MEQRCRATVEYDGFEFLGFQVQAQGRTIQGELERAIERVTQRRIRVVGAGRTDAGVHAVGQVIAFTAVWRHSIQDLHRALNAVLPAEIAITHLAVTHPEFHPRFDAIWRHYRYTVLNRPIRSPLRGRYAHHVPGSIDVAAMRAASQYLIGHRDFAAFGKPTQGESTVREVKRAEWFVEGNEFVFEITANAFLYRMVRNIVGTLLRVGGGNLKPDEVATLLESGDRAAVGPPAPARGLCLMKVDYAD
jgi:tRNA pseudouridine38-40 synthase